MKSVRGLTVAYNNFGAMVWCDGVLMNETKADVRLFDDSLDGLGAVAIYAHLMESGGKSDKVGDIYHAVLGDGDIRIGIYKQGRITIVKRSENGYEVLYDGGITESDIIKTFDVPEKYVVERTTLNHRAVGNLYTKMWLDGHRFERKHTKAMRNRWGGKKMDVGGFSGFCFLSKHQKDWARKPKKKVSLGVPRVRKGRVLLPDNMWFSANLGGITVYIGIDEFMRIGYKESVWDYVTRIAVELDDHVWTCRVGCAYGNGWEGNEEIPERLYEAVRFDA